MSEEILKALMQLFAIICKQDLGLTDTERNFVEKILRDNLTIEQATEYLKLFDSYFVEADINHAEEDLNPDGTPKKKKLTNVKDSVRTLAICKKINKTLEQKQKVIVLIRVLELVNKEKEAAQQKMEIVDTVASVFNIPNEEYHLLQAYIASENLTKDISDANFMIIGDLNQAPEAPVKYIHDQGMEGIIGVVHIKSTDMYFMHYIGNSTIQVNGVVADSSWTNIIPHGAIIKTPIGTPIFYSDISGKFLSDFQLAKLSFNVVDLEYKFGGEKVGLSDIQISETAGKLVAIMGSSGSGKTTLLNVMAGLKEPTNGKILVNGINMHTQSDQIEGLIGYVAQDDILFEDLTVYENLYYNAKLCFGNIAEEEIIEKVHATLKDLGLFEIRDIKVGSVIKKRISGGQRKRLNIALELIREPAIMFLDEPTSGLSSKDSENVIDLLKELTLKGKLIFVVIHQPSSDIYKIFDKIIILDVGGKQIYYGNPVEAITHFKHATGQINAEVGQCACCGNVTPELIFDSIETRVVDEYGRQTEKRKFSPNDWENLYKKRVKVEIHPDETEKPERHLTLPSLTKQLMVFIKRDVLSKISNRQYMLINLLEAPMLAIILAFVIKHTDHPEEPYYFGLNGNIPAYLLMSVIVSLFMGLTVSAEEIIKDEKIIRRERFLHLSRFSYINSKVIILFTLSAIQTITYVWFGNTILEIDGMNWRYWMILFSTSCFANMLGLNISSAFNSAVTIYVLIPILLIPQMILSGAIFSFDKLNYSISSKERAPLISDLIAARWAFEALSVTQFRDNKFEKHFYEIEQKESFYNYKNAYWAPYLIEEIDECISLIQNKKGPSDPIFEKNIDLVSNELAREHDKRKDFVVPEKELAQAVKGDIKALEKIREVVVALKETYTDAFVEINNKKDNMVNAMLSDKKKAVIFHENQKKYSNEALNDWVKNITEKKKLIELNGKLIQKSDPVFKLPTKPSNMLNYRTHLYSPYKYFVGKKIDTFWFNVGMLWVMSLFLYLILYFAVLFKIMNIFSYTKKVKAQQ